MFYLHWIDNLKIMGNTPNYWLILAKEPRWKSWAGYAFESVCYKHIPQILAALKLENQAKEIGSWRFIAKNSNQQGTQIDLLIDRNDETITVCEIKYSQKLFSIDKSYAADLKKKKLKHLKERPKQKNSFFYQ